MKMSGVKEGTLYLPFRNTVCECEMICFERLLKYLLVSWVEQKITVTIKYYSNFSNQTVHI